MAATEREVLIKLDKFEHLSEFLHECVNSLSKKNHDFPDPDSNMSSDTIWTQQELKQARLQIQNFFRQNGCKDENFSLPNDLPQNLRNALANVYKVRQKDIFNLVIKKNLVNSGHNLVENIDWKLKWILGSSNLATIRETVCQVDLRCVSSEKGSTEINMRNVNFECNMAKIDELISLLSNVKNELDGL